LERTGKLGNIEREERELIRKYLFWGWGFGLEEIFRVGG
jgi:hypothetical protein